MIGTNWECPYCQHKITISNGNYLSKKLHLENKKNTVAATVKIIQCVNHQCNKCTILLNINDVQYIPLPRDQNPHFHTFYQIKEPSEEKAILPTSNAKVFPDYIPLAIRQDYEEACLIKNLSSKASATLSRRCLQVILEDFWKVSKKQNLHVQIDSIREHIDELTWKAIHGIREIGNIGAHMKGEINSIVDVEPDEASYLIQLIEILIEDSYIARHDREQKLNRVIQTAENKKLPKAK